MKKFDEQGRIVDLDVSDIPPLTAMISWSAEQWADHDAKVAEINRANAAAAKLTPEAKLRDRGTGFPERAIAAAAVAKPTSAVEKIKTWNHAEKCVLVLAGSPGCGKTVAATHWAMHNRPGATFVRASTFAASSRYDRAERSQWLKAQALVLDDLGGEYVDTKGSLMADLDELVDTYYGDNRPLLITTNLDRDAFKARYGQRITDRFRECGRWIAIASESMRGAK